MTEMSHCLITLCNIFNFCEPCKWSPSISFFPSAIRTIFCRFLPSPLSITFLYLLREPFPLFSFSPSAGSVGFFPSQHTPLGSSPSDGFNYHLNADDSQTSSPSLDLSPFLQSHISFCLQNISTWVSHHLLKLNMSETELIISPHPLSFSPCFSKAVNSTLSTGSNPWSYQMGTGQSVTPCFRKADFGPHIPSQLKIVLTNFTWDLRKGL